MYAAQTELIKTAKVTLRPAFEVSTSVWRGIALLKGCQLFRLEGLWFWHGLRGHRKRRTYEKTQSPYLQRSSERGVARRLSHRHGGAFRPWLTIDCRLRTMTPRLNSWSLFWVLALAASVFNLLGLPDADLHSGSGMSPVILRSVHCALPLFLLAFTASSLATLWPSAGTRGCWRIVVSSGSHLPFAWPGI